MVRLAIPLLLMVAPLFAENEAFYRDLFAKENGGKTEVVLIIEDEKDRRFLVRLKSLLVHRKLNDVSVWTIDKAGEIKREFPN